MSQITIDVPLESPLALKTTSEEAGDLLRMAAAVKLFELGRVSSGAAAQLAGVPRTVFLSRLTRILARKPTLFRGGMNGLNLIYSEHLFERECS